MLKFILGMCLLLVAACDGGAPQTSAQKLVGQPFPLFEVMDGAGDTVPVIPERIEKPIVLNVWATWCPPCIKEMPALDALGAQGNYKVIAVATDRNRKAVSDYLREQPLNNIRILHDAGGKHTREHLYAVGLPHTYIIDTQGIIRAVEAGERQWDHPAMQQKIRNVLN